MSDHQIIKLIKTPFRKIWGFLFNKTLTHSTCFMCVFRLSLNIENH